MVYMQYINIMYMYDIYVNPVGANYVFMVLNYTWFGNKV